MADEIKERILIDYSDNPNIEDLKPGERTYAKLMECLTPMQRKTLLKGYIDKAKVNVAHIYLAQLLQEGYADYILTVNFDNLMLRALALFNKFPATYDMAILNELTTTNFHRDSVVYLHGQHHGLWLLNTEYEMSKVENIITRIFDSIKSGRPWVFIGYSGDDPIFEHIKKMGCFDNGLYWVGYKDYDPIPKVKDFLSDPKTGASIIKGYDADSFMLALNNELGLPQPLIVDKPFTALKETLEEIVDIDDDDHFRGVKERLIVSKNQVEQAIDYYEKGNKEAIEDLGNESEISALKKQIVDMIINKDFDEDKVLQIEEKVLEFGDDVGLLDALASLCFGWGNSLSDLGEAKKGEEQESLFRESMKKYERASILNEEDSSIWYNWGNVLLKLGRTKKGEEQESLFKESMKKYERASILNKDNSSIWNNWGSVLFDLGKIKKGEEQESLFRESIGKCERASILNEEDSSILYNWGVVLFDLGEIKKGEEQESLFRESMKKYERASILNKDNSSIWYNWGTTLLKFGGIKEGEEQESLFRESMKKFERASILNEDNSFIWDNWGTTLLTLGGIKEGEEQESLFKEALEKGLRCVELGGRSYNLACTYSLLKDKDNALKYLEVSLQKQETTTEFVLADDDWAHLTQDEAFKKIISQFSKPK